MKKCFKCDNEKSLSEFYVHKQMSDGHLNKCKECTKKDTAERSKTLDLESERDRGREKYHRLYSGTGKARPENSKRWINKFPEKRAA